MKHERPGPGPDAPVPRIVWEAVRHGTPRAKRGVLLIAITWVAMFIVQLWDIRGRHGLGVVTELTSSLLGMGGILLVAFTSVLRQLSEGDACEPAYLWRTSKSRAFNELLLALPAAGFVAGAMLAAALAIALMRRALGSGILIYLIVVMDAFFLALAGLTVTQTSRLLYRHAREQAEAATRAAAAATEARLSALQSQLNPHFLFNTLNTVASLVRTDARAAEHTIENLSEVLRRTLERSGDLLRTLGDEIAYVRAYLAIEQERFGDRLNVEWSIAPGAESPMVPTMTLQPLVENAVKHGIAARVTGGHLRIAASRDAERLRLVVEDDGEGFPPRYQEGTGLSNLRKRLETMYGANAALRIESSSSGSRVIVELPIDRDVRL